MIFVKFQLKKMPNDAGAMRKRIKSSHAAHAHGKAFAGSTFYAPYFAFHFLALPIGIAFASAFTIHFKKRARRIESCQAPMPPFADAYIWPMMIANIEKLARPILD